MIDYKIVNSVSELPENYTGFAESAYSKDSVVFVLNGEVTFYGFEELFEMYKNTPEEIELRAYMGILEATPQKD